MRFNVTKEQIIENASSYGLFVSLYLPKTLTEISSGLNVFQDRFVNLLQHIHIPPSVTKICENAFSNYYNSNGYYIPQTVKYVGKTIFGRFSYRSKVMASKKTECHDLEFKKFDDIYGYLPLVDLKVVMYD